jgi:hypothetical protein
LVSEGLCQFSHWVFCWLEFDQKQIDFLREKRNEMAILNSTIEPFENETVFVTEVAFLRRDISLLRSELERSISEPGRPDEDHIERSLRMLKTQGFLWSDQWCSVNSCEFSKGDRND